jgi:hypothetical protein
MKHSTNIAFPVACGPFMVITFHADRDESLKDEKNVATHDGKT